MSEAYSWYRDIGHVTGWKRGYKTEQTNLGLCDPACPPECQWRKGDECRYYRGRTWYDNQGEAHKTRRVSYEACRRKEGPR